VGSDLTARYLDVLVASGRSAAELARPALESDLLTTAYRGERFLSRPVFLPADAVRTIGDDLERLCGLLSDLPRRLFGGDMRALGEAVGLDDVQLQAITTSAPPLPSLGRADMHRTAEGFKLLEYNTGSPLGGFDIAELCRAMLAVDVLADFVEGHRLAFADTLSSIVRLMLATARDRDMPSRPFVAIADWPSSYPTMARRLDYMSRLVAPMGIDAAGCHAGQLERRSGRLVLDGRPVDIVYRFFLVEDLLETREAPEVMGRILDAHRDGEVLLFTDLESDVYGSKAALALLSDDEYRAELDADDVDFVDRLLPWTRVVRRTETTVDGGTRDLVDYVLEQREELILKAPNLHGGASVVPGWTCDQAEWRERVEHALTASTVVQRRMQPSTEPFLLDDGVHDMALNWGIFLVAGRYAGSVIRATTDERVGVLSMAAGARIACAFHEPSDQR
jgi:hypothetical protein